MATTITIHDELTVLRVPGAGSHSGTLVVRLGAADGLPHENGAPHLLEHHALAPFLTNADVHGAVTPLTTVLGVRAATPEAVAEQLGEITARLMCIEDEELNRERSVLHAEARRGASLVATVANILFGLRGVGQCALLPFAEETMRAEGLEAFAAPFLTRANVALVLTQDVPVPTLTLPRGPAPAVPGLPTVLGRIPGAIEGDTLAPVVCGLVSPGPAAEMAAATLEHALLASLRGDAGLAYSCGVSLQSIARDAALMCCSCDAAPADAERAIALMLETIERLATEGPTATELTRVREVMPSPLDHSSMVGWSVAQAEHGLSHGPDALRRWTLEAHAAVTGDDVRSVVSALQASLLALGPTGSTPDSLPPHHVPTEDRVDGDRYRRRLAPHDPESPTAIVIGPGGLTAEELSDELTTIRHDDAALITDEVGGGVTVLGFTGAMITVDPRNLRSGDDAVAAVRQLFAGIPNVPLAGTTEAIADAAEGAFTRITSDHIERLPALLETGEDVRCIEEATAKTSVGALVITDRRVLFLRGVIDTKVEAWRHDQIGYVRDKRRAPGWNYLHVELDGKKRKFGFTKRGRLERARDALEAAVPR